MSLLNSRPVFHALQGSTRSNLHGTYGQRTLQRIHHTKEGFSFFQRTGHYGYGNLSFNPNNITLYFTIKMIRSRFKTRFIQNMYFSINMSAPFSYSWQVSCCSFYSCFSFNPVVLFTQRPSTGPVPIPVACRTTKTTKLARPPLRRHPYSRRVGQCSTALLS